MKLKSYLLPLALAPVIIGANPTTSIAQSCYDDPFCIMSQRMQEVIKNFRNAYPSNYGNVALVINPKIELVNNENEMVVKADIPGIKKDELNIELFENYLIISGERKTDIEEHSDDYRFSEISYGKFSRNIKLPARADISGAKTDYKDGVITITIPKVEEEKPNSRKLTI